MPKPSLHDLRIHRSRAEALLDCNAWPWLREWVQAQIDRQPVVIDASTTSIAQYAEAIGMIKAYKRVLEYPQSVIDDAIAEERKQR